MSQNQQPISETEQSELASISASRQSTRPHGSIEWLVFCGLISAGVGARLLCRDLPNFAPVAALALFSGYFFSSGVLAVAVPILVMLMSDALLGTYNPELMIVVYGMLALPVALRGLLRRQLKFTPGQPRASACSSLAVIGFSVLASVAFFLVTNLAVWWQASWYTTDLAGLTHCYLQALPFFRYTLSGDLLFTIVLFGGYALVTARSLELKPVRTESA